MGLQYGGGTKQRRRRRRDPTHLDAEAAEAERERHERAAGGIAALQLIKESLQGGTQSTRAFNGDIFCCHLHTIVCLATHSPLPIRRRAERP